MKKKIIMLGIILISTTSLLLVMLYMKTKDIKYISTNEINGYGITMLLETEEGQINITEAPTEGNYKIEYTCDNNAEISWSNISHKIKIKATTIPVKCTLAFTEVKPDISIISMFLYNPATTNYDEINNLNNAEKYLIKSECYDMETDEPKQNIIVEYNYNNQKLTIHPYTEKIYCSLYFAENYINEGLIMHLDSYNNTSNGYATNTTIWYDRSGNQNYLSLQSANPDITAIESWGMDGSVPYYLTVDDPTMKNYLFGNNPMYNNMGGKPNMTVEIHYEEIRDAWGGIIDFGADINNTSYGGSYMELWAQNNVSTDCTLKIDYGTSKNFSANDLSSKSRNLTAPEYIGSGKYTISYGKGNSNYFSFINASGKQTESIASIPSELRGWDRTTMTIGRSCEYRNFDTICYYPHVKIYGFRMYNRQLTDEEVLINYMIDKARYSNYY